MASSFSLRQHIANLKIPISDKSQPPAISRVKEGIYNARCFNHESAAFVPNNELDKLLTRGAISDVIASTANLPACELGPELPAIVDQICHKDQRNRHDSRKRIFAILIMAGIPSSIIDFLDADIWDRHLPFQYQKRSSDRQLEYIKDDGSLATCPFRCFDNDLDRLHTFEVSQWAFMAPLFNFTEGTIHHHPIQHRIPLPFTEESPIPTQGGNSQVSQVVIHHGHHDLIGAHHFAVKRLLSSTDENFNKEVEALKLVRKLRHPHLIELLGTYEYRHSYYLIFRWAVDDLETFWRSNPSPHSAAVMSTWTLQQCLGIAKGLQLIHSGQFSPSERPTIRGRHGDIKPANILRYEPRVGSQDPVWGVLKISDFGLTRFHQNDSYRREYTNGPMATRTYRAPEGDLRRKISYLWDLWPLGCLYLEFLTWLLQGWDGVVAFSEERHREDQSPYPDFYKEDKFFNMDRMKNFGACRKNSVRKRVDALHNHPDCTDFIHDFLDLISEDLIRIRDERRAKCDRIVQRLEFMERKCEDNEGYYTKRQRRFAKRATCESDKPRKLNTAVSNVGLIHQEHQPSDTTRASHKPVPESESGAEENSLSKVKNRPQERRRLRGFSYFLGSCFHSNARYPDDSGK